MNSIALFFGCVAAIAPSAVSAALALQIGPNDGPGQVDAVVAPGSGEHFFDLTFRETGTPENEGLWAYDLLVRAPRPGITLLRAEKPDNWVMADSNNFVIAESDAGHLLVNARINNDLYDITTGKEAARVFYSVDAGAAPGLYNITLDPSATIFANGQPLGALPDIPVDISDPGVVRVTPEPSALALLAVGGLLALRRRRGR